jgi:prepilin-type N-terminal cleavage/methylation domain-containing protein
VKIPRISACQRTFSAQKSLGISNARDKTMQPTDRSRAFTLIELLCVIAIIGILASLLLPAVTRGTARAKQIQCVGHLHQIGLAFHSFAHDHGGKFPMAVPARAGGSMEFVQNAYKLSGEFYFAFRHFQARSIELILPQVLVCPADIRSPAPNLAVLKNENVSFFIGIRSDYSAPNSILAGDRNLTNDAYPATSIVHADTTQSLRWTDELHRFKGNLLFADARVEQNSLKLALAGRQAAAADFFLPSVKTYAATQSSSPAPGSGAGAGDSGAADKSQAGTTGINVPPPKAEPFPSHAATRKVSSPAPSLTTNLGPNPRQPIQRTNDPAVLPLELWFGAVVQEATKKDFWPIYLLLFLLLTVLFTLEVRRRIRAQQKRLRRFRL